MTALQDLLLAFWDNVLIVWDMAFFGVSVGRTALAILIMLVFFAVRRGMAHFIVERLKVFAARTQTKADDLTLEAIEQPLILLPMVFGFFIAARVLQLEGDAALGAEKIVQSLIAVAIFWALARATTPIGYVLGRVQGALTIVLIDWIVKALRVLFYAMGAATVLQIWGVPVLPILASFSLLSVAVALGAQDLFKNLISGALIIAERRFQPGDWIKVDGVVEGTVERINFRSTRVRRFDKAPVNVPNAKLSDDAVINFTDMTHRRIYWMIGLEYRTTGDQLRRIRDEIEAYILENPDFANPTEVSTFVRIDKFSDSSIDIMLYCFTKTTVWGEWLQIKEELALKIKDIVEGAGAGFAFPSQSVYLESLPDEAERFTGSSSLSSRV